MMKKNTNWQKWIGVAACIVIIAACFAPWTYYPDIQKHFTGFNTWTFIPQKNKWGHYYGRPGVLLVPFAAICLILHLVRRMWAKWTNLVVAALCAAYTLSRYFMFTNGYGNVQPQQEFGLWLVAGGAIVNLAMAIMAKV